MVVYSCPRCGYSSNLKANIKRHFLKKNICSATCLDIPIDECYREVLGEEYQKVNESKCSVNVFESKSKCLVNESKCFECRYCGKGFKQKQGRYQHEPKFCKEKDTFTKDEVMGLLENKDKLINELSKQIEVLLTKVGNTTNNTNNTNNYTQQNNYIIINAFGKENTDYLTAGSVNKLIKSGPFKSIPRLLKNLHFNPEHKENHNVKIPNRKEKYATVYDGEKWEFRDKKETIEDLTDKAYNLLEDHFDGKNKHMNKFINQYDNDDKVVKKVYNDTEMMILNNQEEVVKNAK